jgi:hypothetical protein
LLLALSTPPPQLIYLPTCMHVYVRVYSSIHLHTYPSIYKISVNPFTHSIHPIYLTIFTVYPTLHQPIQSFLYWRCLWRNSVTESTNTQLCQSHIE